jgi:hypothetical protein
MTEPSEIRDQHLRITILRLLAEEPDDALNESFLHDLLIPFRFGISRDKMLAELDWLSEQGLVKLEDLHGLTVATLTSKGARVAAGDESVRGVKKPTRL